MKIKIRYSFAIAGLVCLAAGRGESAVFTIDSSRSSITLSGTALGYPLVEQSAGSLTSQFSGSVNATVTDTSVAFGGLSLISVKNNGNWQPKSGGEPGSDPANFGGQASAGFLGSVLAAMRNSLLDVTSAVLPVTGGNFDSGSILYQFVAGSGGALDYNIAGLFATKGSIALAGLATNRVTSLASLTTAGGTQTLTIPVTADFYFKLLSANDTKLTVTGQIVATQSSAPAMKIVQEADGRVAVSWPGSVIGFALQQSQSSTSGLGWSIMTDIPVVENGRNVIRLQPASQTQFYRLASGI